MNAVRLNYQNAYQDIDGVIAQRDDRNNQVLQLQQDVNLYRQQNIALQKQVNQLTQERDTFQNDLTLMTIAYNNEQGERRHWWVPGIVSTRFHIQ